MSRISHQNETIARPTNISNITFGGLVSGDTTYDELKWNSTLTKWGNLKDTEFYDNGFILERNFGASTMNCVFQLSNITAGETRNVRINYEGAPVAATNTSVNIGDVYGLSSYVNNCNTLMVGSISNLYPFNSSRITCIGDGSTRYNSGDDTVITSTAFMYATGNKSIGIGYYTGTLMSDATNSIIIGKGAAERLSYATNSVSLGYGSLIYGTYFNDSVALGVDIMDNGTTVDGRCVVIGAAAYRNNDGNTSYDCVMIGSSVGWTSGTGPYNVMIGADTNHDGNGIVTKTVVIGRASVYYDVNCSNTVIIGAETCNSNGFGDSYCGLSIGFFNANFFTSNFKDIIIGHRSATSASPMGGNMAGNLGITIGNASYCPDSTYGADVITIGNNSNYNLGADENLTIGNGVYASITGNYNITCGNGSISSASNVTKHIIFGIDTAKTLVDTSNNVFFGSNLFTGMDTINNAVCISTDEDTASDNVAISPLTFIGKFSGTGLTSDAAGCVVLGKNRNDHNVKNLVINLENGSSIVSDFVVHSGAIGTLTEYLTVVMNNGGAAITRKIPLYTAP